MLVFNPEDGNYYGNWNYVLSSLNDKRNVFGGLAKVILEEIDDDKKYEELSLKLDQWQNSRFFERYPKIINTMMEHNCATVTETFVYESAREAQKTFIKK
ncbi:MAG: hypothetical protein PHQ89_00095 [Bacilli bacterium]|nr:hypothetical protein [Bacilli bacterium]